MAKLKWKKDEHGNIFDIRDGHRSFIIEFNKIESFERKYVLRIHFYGSKMSIPFKYLTSAKACAQLIHNG